MNRRIGTAFLLLTLLCFTLAMLSISIGSIRIPVEEILPALFSDSHAGIYRDIILQLRLPRMLAAAILGGALSLSGYLLQTYFHNPIAGPFILGVSSGAKLAVASVMILFLRLGGRMTSLGMITAAFAGSMLSMAFVLLMARTVKHMSVLLISGVMVGYICSAVTDLIVTFADDADIVNLHNWSKGSFSGVSIESIGVMAAVVGLALLLTFMLSKPMSVYQMGESYAASLGVPVRFFRAALVLLSSILSAVVTAYAGPISFVGIAVPHLAKNLLRSGKPILMIPACFLGGASFCMFCDLLARTMLAPSELSISTVTSIFGAPVVMAILFRRQSTKG